jgi:hypothetical protein
MEFTSMEFTAVAFVVAAYIVQSVAAIAVVVAHKRAKSGRNFRPDRHPVAG